MPSPFAGRPRTAANSCRSGTGTASARRSSTCRLVSQPKWWSTCCARSPRPTERRRRFWINPTVPFIERKELVDNGAERSCILSAGDVVAERARAGNARQVTDREFAHGDGSPMVALLHHHGGMVTQQQLALGNERR